VTHFASLRVPLDAPGLSTGMMTKSYDKDDDEIDDGSDCDKDDNVQCVNLS